METTGPYKTSSRRLFVFATIAVIALWFVPFGGYLTLPIRYFVTFLHELSHALAASATGGYATSMQIFENASGLTMIAGGWPLLTYSAGYVGTTLFGCGLLVLGNRPGSARNTFFGLFALILFTTIYWVRPVWSFGFIVGIVVAGLLFVAGRYLRGNAATFVLQFLAVQTALSAIGDIGTLLRLNGMGSQENDAAFLAGQTHIPALLWAILWACGSGFIMVMTIRRLWAPAKSR